MKRTIVTFCLLLLCASCVAQTPTTFPTATLPSATLPTSDGGTAINQIQGITHRSPMDGETIAKVIGVVTVVDGEGFYLQSLVQDNDERTSEAIYVDLEAYANVKRGDQVLVVDGWVREWNPAGLGANSLTITTLVAKDVTVLSQTQPLPEPVVIGEGGRLIPNQVIENDVNGYVGQSKQPIDPQEDGMDFFESLEGMLVQINNARAVSTRNGYNEVSIVADSGENAGILSSEGVLVLRETDPNPERILLDDAYIMMPEIHVGAVFSEPIVGVVDYDFGNYRIQPLSKPVLSQNTPFQTIKASGVQEDWELAIASYNLKNFNSLQEVERSKQIAWEIVEMLKAPDILVLQEIMDDDGSLDSQEISAERNLASLIDDIVDISKGKVVYKALNIDPVRNADGGLIGGNIRTVILYQSKRGLLLPGSENGKAIDEVGLRNENGRAMLSLNPGRIWPGNYAFLSSRKPIIAHFVFNGQDVYVIGNHFNSKGEDGPLYGDQQPPQRPSERQRIAQAKAVNGFVRDILDINPKALIVVLGDLNDFPWSVSMETLEGALLENLSFTLPENQRFTYLHEGNGQILDQILASKALAPRLVSYEVIHINSLSLSRNVSSDHDPVVAVFDLSALE
ncbi:MAG TPA: endonuclease/exonuclease/phosphatase family protein [Anaerolineaceae bacterium]|nr:endonuclease/exonuclease/phosphatase family protein [Anaerolineaceae bacterium]